MSRGILSTAWSLAFFFFTRAMTCSLRSGCCRHPPRDTAQLCTAERRAGRAARGGPSQARRSRRRGGGSTRSPSPSGGANYNRKDGPSPTGREAAQQAQQQSSRAARRAAAQPAPEVDASPGANRTEGQEAATAGNKKKKHNWRCKEEPSRRENTSPRQVCTVDHRRRADKSFARVSQRHCGNLHPGRVRTAQLKDGLGESALSVALSSKLPPRGQTSTLNSSVEP